MSEIDKPYIESKVKDWLDRIENVYNTVKTTLKDFNDIKIVSTRQFLMYEELMQQFDVPPTNVPILDLKQRGSLLATFKPVGLWVIGANGRIDILTKDGAFILVDVSEKGSPSTWKVYTPKNRKDGKQFDSTFIKELVS
jgi:hypothetical protein